MSKTGRNAVDNAQAWANADILNAIRNSNNMLAAEIPAADGTRENLIKIGDVIEGNPAFIQHFSSMLTQIASVRVSSRSFDEYYTAFIKGDVEYGGMIEEVFVNLTRARDFAPAKANAREFQQVRPRISNAFHKMNWSAQYTATIDRNDIRKAFRSADGVVGLIDKIVNTLRSSHNVDHKLLVEYLVKRSILNGSIKALATGDGNDLTQLAVNNRSTAARFAMPTKRFNAAGVYTHTPKDDQWLIVDADTWAEYDVTVLANAFNMDKASLLNRTVVIDQWDDFDYERFEDVNEAHKQIEPFTAEETEKLSHVRAVMCDLEAFQIYNLTYQTSDAWIASALRTNYFLTVERIYSWSPFSNAIAFVEDEYAPGDPETVTATVDSVSESAQSTVVTFTYDVPVGKNGNVSVAQTDEMTEGDVLARNTAEMVFAKTGDAATSVTMVVNVGDSTLTGTAVDVTTVAPGDTITLTAGGEADD